MDNEILNNPGAMTVVIIVIVFGFLAFIIIGCLAYWQYNNDKWLPSKKKKEMNFFRAKLPHFFIAISFFFLILVIAFLKAIIS